MRTVYLHGGRPRHRIGGAIASLITPFRNDVIDRVGLIAHVEWQILNGIDGLAVGGPAGEGPLLTELERLTVIATCVEIADGKVPVIAATGSNDTARTIDATRQAARLGIDAALLTVPYYSKPTQAGIVAHFDSIAAATDIPIIIDSQPALTGIDLTPLTIERLGRIGGIIGIVDGTGDITRPHLWAPLLPASVGLYTSHDGASLAFTLAGGAGCFSASANVVPRLIAALQHAATAGNLTAANSLQARLRPLWQALDRDGTAAALKQALTVSHRLIDAAVRLPLVGVEPDVGAAIESALEMLHQENCGAGTATPDLSRLAATLRF